MKFVKRGIQTVEQYTLKLKCTLQQLWMWHIMWHHVIMNMLWYVYIIFFGLKILCVGQNFIFLGWNFCSVNLWTYWDWLGECPTHLHYCQKYWMRMENTFSVGSKNKVKTDKPTIIRAGLLEWTKYALDHLTLLCNSIKLIRDILQ